jgi:hypothetical protein
MASDGRKSPSAPARSSSPSFSSSSSAAPSGSPPVSPRAAAPRLFKVLAAHGAGGPDAGETHLNPSLGPKSSSHPNVPFPAGGGFTSVTERRATLSDSDRAGLLAAKTAGWNSARPDKRGPAPTLARVPTHQPTFSGDLEYHPPGGIHSNYSQAIDDSVGGSYLRVHDRLGGGGERRYGRHGAFDSKATFDHQPLDRSAQKKPPAEKLAEARAPVISDSPPPSPRTAGRIVENLFAAPEATMKSLARGRPYSEIAAPPMASPRAAAFAPPIASASSAPRVAPSSAMPAPDLGFPAIPAPAQRQRSTSLSGRDVSPPPAGGRARSNSGSS